MKKKAIIFDIDGTAVDSPLQKLPTRTLINEIRRLEDKYYFCAATGRVLGFAKPFLDALGLKDLSIISAGTQIYNPTTQEMVWQKNLDQDALDKALTILKRYPDWKILYNDETEDDYFHGGVFPADFKNSEPTYFVEQVFVPDEIAKEICEKLCKIEGIAAVMAIAQKPKTRDIHIIDAKATKEHTVSILLKLLGINKEDTIGIGDGHNDIHLFNAVHYKVAMGNAVPELKKRADKIIGPVTEDGMASYLETL